MIDIHSETVIPLSRVPHHVPRNPDSGNRIHSSTAWRWVQRGIRGIRLESILIGGKRYSSLEKLDAFIAATTAAADGDGQPVRTSRQRDQEIAAAERELSDAGI